MSLSLSDFLKSNIQLKLEVGLDYKKISLTLFFSPGILSTVLERELSNLKRRLLTFAKRRLI